MDSTGEKIGGGEIRGDLKGIYQQRGEKVLDLATASREELLQARERLLERAKLLEKQMAVYQERIESLQRQKEAIESGNYKVVDGRIVLGTDAALNVGRAVDNATKQAKTSSTPATGEDIINEVEGGGDSGTGDAVIEKTDDASGNDRKDKDSETGERGSIAGGEKPTDDEIRETIGKAKKRKAIRALLCGFAAMGIGLAWFGVTKKAAEPESQSSALEDVLPEEEGNNLDESDVEYFDGEGGTVVAESNEEKEEVNPYAGDTVVAESNEEKEEVNPYAGELPNGTKYDYSHYADREHKEAFNAFDYDMSDAYDNREKTTDGIMEVAGRSPEALAAYAVALLSDAEKQELGIGEMSSTELDDYLSTNENGGKMQTLLLDRLRNVLAMEDTSFVFYHENGTEKTHYIYFVDDNNDGKMSPEEMHLGYDVRMRNGAPQVDIYRSFVDKDGVRHENVKMADLNMLCGYQLNFEQAPADVPYVPANWVPGPTVSASDIPYEIVTPTPMPEPEIEWEVSEEEEEKTTPTPDPEPTPTPEPEPTPTPEPEPTPTPDPESTPTPEPEPTPTPDPEPTPTPEPEPTPTPDPEPTPTPEPEPTPTPDPEPTPTPEPEPTPTPEPEPTPTPEPTPSPEPTPTPEPLQPKNLEAESENAGSVVTPMELNENVTPKTTLEEDQANFEAIRKQQEEDKAKEEEAKRVAAEQAERERQAAIDAEQRRLAEEAARQAELAQMEDEARQERERAEAEAQAQANEAATKAADQAAADQAAANTLANQEAAEQAQREQMQAEANAQAPANSAESETNAGATAAERADMFANGDF